MGAPVLDPATRTASIEVEVPNSDNRLKPGMYANLAFVGRGRAVGFPTANLDRFPAPTVHARRAVKPVVISDWSGYNYRNGGKENAVERAFRLITEGKDVLDALIEGVNIPELDPAETGIGYGALPNADGVVQLDASCMHGPKKRAGAVAALEGVRTPSAVARAVADYTDHHLLAGKGAQEFARATGFTIETDLNTDLSRRLWLEWRRRVDPEHWLDPNAPARRPPSHERDSGFAARALAAGRSMVSDGLIPEGSFWGTINCDAINASGDICGVTTTSGLAWKIPGRVGDSPILGAGLYVDGAVGAAGSTGRGEANLFNLCSFLIVEEMRRGAHPTDAAIASATRHPEAFLVPRARGGEGEQDLYVAGVWLMVGAIVIARRER